MNTYAIHTMDIKPKGFSVLELNGYVTEKAVHQARKVLTDPEYYNKMVTCNYEIARRYYSYSVLDQKLKNLISDYINYKV